MVEELAGEKRGVEFVAVMLRLTVSGEPNSIVSSLLLSPLLGEEGIAELDDEMVLEKTSVAAVWTLGGGAGGLKEEEESSAAAVDEDRSLTLSSGASIWPSAPVIKRDSIVHKLLEMRGSRYRGSRLAVECVGIPKVPACDGRTDGRAKTAERNAKGAQPTPQKTNKKKRKNFSFFVFS